MQLDPVQGVLGALGWALFAISWAGDSPAVTTLPTTPAAPAAPRSPDQSPHRRALPKGAAVVLALVSVAAAVPMVLAWSVRTVERALLAHAVALAAAIALVAFAVDLFEPRSRAEQAGFDASKKPERRIAAALPAFVALTALAVLGAAYTLLR